MPAASGSSTKTIVILSADGVADDRVTTDAFEASLRNQWPGRLRFFTEDVDSSRFTPETYEHHLSEYLRGKHGGRVDVVVVLSAVALDFVLPNRDALFPGVPNLFAGAGKTAAELQQAHVAGVIIKPDPGGTVDIALRLHPGARRVVVVGGTGHLDRIAEEAARRDLAALAGRMPVVYLTELSVPDMLDRVANLPPETILLYTRVSRDATGASFTPREVLQQIRSATSLPIYGGSNSYVGAGIVGGSVVDQATIGGTLALLGGRILAGEPTSDMRPVVARNIPAFDWNELQRLGISERRLPAGAVVRNRQPTPWERYAPSLPYLALAAALVLVLGAALVLQRRERRHLGLALNEWQRFETLLSDLSTTFITLPAGDIDLAVRGALRRVLDCINADRATIYDIAEAPDSCLTVRFSEVWHRSGLEPVTEDWELDRAPWVISRLRAGQVLAVDDANRDEFAALPRSVLPASVRAAIAVPLFVGSSMLGVLWCVTQRKPQMGREQAIEQFRLLGELFANALRRRQIEQKLDETNELNAAIFQSLSQHVAVVDRAGTILAVNDAWRDFGRENGAPSDAAIGPGANYLEVARRAAEEGAPLAQEAFEAIRAVCERRRDGYSLEYECPSPSENRWFLMTVAALRRKEGGAVITHRDVTMRKRAEIAIGESEERFRTMADALPVNIWMAAPDAARTYFNRAWLEYTGRPLEREIGNGWADSLHPDDSRDYLDVYRGAVASREPFSIEYRIRRRDGAYGWFIDNAVPLYGADGGARGFIGGGVDITDRKEAEDAMRDLAARLITAQEDDRRRLARELHDGLNQLVALLAIEIEQLGFAPPPTPQQLTGRVHELWNRTTEISTEVHRLSHQLHPLRLETFGLVAAIEGYCTELRDQQQLRVTFVHDPAPLSVPPDIALCLFRIVQEALRNVIKHSDAREATVELTAEHDAVLLRVADVGRGFDAAAAPRKGGLGLVSMRERVRSAGGELTIVSRPGQGTQITVRLPVPAEAVEEPAMAGRTATV